MTNRDVIRTFFESYQKGNFTGMQRCLDPSVEFSDLAFRKITGADVLAMWHWYCVPTKTRRDPIKVPLFEIVKAESDRAKARYEVNYTLEGEHAVKYVIESDFTLHDGKITSQIDTPTISQFQFARMTVGFPACLLALTPFFKLAIRSEMKKKLAEFRDTFANP